MVEMTAVQKQRDSSYEIPNTSKFYLIMKRLLDIVLSASALCVLSPLLLVTAILVFLDCPKVSPIFSQVRVGQNGKLFRFYKFRSMIPDAEKQKDALLPWNEMDGPAFKIKEDPRITRFGKWIRKTYIDELPQLWNVFRGEMSIVGPRPGLPSEVERYDPFAASRLRVKPGLTCYWQSRPDHNHLNFDQWMELDSKYIRECSLLTDCKIMLATIGTVLSMSGE